MTNENEIGRELKASELTPRTVVVIVTPGRGVMMTMWVLSLSEKLVEFYSGELKWTVLNFIEPDGSIRDDQGRVVHVYEYLGEV